jgi:hypothetical protein
MAHQGFESKTPFARRHLRNSLASSKVTALKSAALRPASLRDKDILEEVEELLHMLDDRERMMISPPPPTFTVSLTRLWY